VTQHDLKTDVNRDVDGYVHKAKQAKLEAEQLEVEAKVRSCNPILM
jgi:hypothetical protein